MVHRMGSSGTSYGAARNGRRRCPSRCPVQDSIGGLMEPSPALNASVLEAILNVDMRAAPPNHEVWNQLIQRMADRDAARVPSAFDRTLPLLAGDVDRLRLATDLIVSFDIYKAMPSLLNLARKLKSSDLALAAAAFASHPGVPESTARIAREELVGIVDMSASSNAHTHR